MNKPQDYILIKLSDAHALSPGYPNTKLSEQSNNLGYTRVNGDSPLGDFLKNTHKPAVMIPSKILQFNCRFINTPACVDDFYNDNPVAEMPTVELIGLSSGTIRDYYICTGLTSLTVRNFDSSVNCHSIDDLAKSNAYRLVINGSFHGKNLSD